jgi:RNA polymerase sigma factor (sigma-70 family)
MMTSRPQRSDAATPGAAPADFAVLYEEHFDAIYGYLCRRVGRDHGEELAAQTFACALRDLHRFDAARGPVRAWLFGIASNVLRSGQRSEIRRLRAIARTGVDDLLFDTDEVDQRVDAKRFTRALAGVLAELSAADREVLLLTAWAELSSEEIGSALGIPAGTVRSRLNRARRQVRRALAGSSDPQEAVHGRA